MNDEAILSIRVAHIEEYLNANVLGQESAINTACSVLKRGALKLSSPARPLGSFLFVGPTGVGKTEFTKRFTHYLFPGKHRLLRFDMSEYQNKEQLEVLLGDSANSQGQIGRLFDYNRDEQGDLLGGTILFDEIEKAHPDLLLILLQILEDGRLTLRDGTLLNVSNFFVVMTSNIGAAEAMEMRKSTPETIERVVFSLVKEKLRPELVGRISEMVMFNRLEYNIQVKIADLMMRRELMRLSEQLNATIEFEKEALEFILIEGFDARLGARPLRRCIEHYVGDALADKILCNELASGTIRVNMDAGTLYLDPCRR